MKEKPVIAVTTGRRAALIECIPFWIAITLAGGRCRRVYPGAPLSPEEVDGLILSGGTDIFPIHFKGRVKPGYRYNHRRDEMELQWIAEARRRDLPVLGVCRGAQLMAVSHKGTLHRAVRKAYPNARYPRHPLSAIYFRKSIRLRAPSTIGRIIKAAALKVNSLHSQAIKHAGRGMVITAQEDNGVVQIIEDPRRHFYIGVQFHPELLLHRRRIRRIFTALVAAARSRRESRRDPANTTLGDGRRPPTEKNLTSHLPDGTN